MSSSEIQEIAKLDETNYQNYRRTLIEKGIIQRAGYGKIEFTLPRFAQFVELMQYFN